MVEALRDFKSLKTNTSKDMKTGRSGVRKFESFLKQYHQYSRLMAVLCVFTEAKANICERNRQVAEDEGLTFSELSQITMIGERKIRELLNDPFHNRRYSEKELYALKKSRICNPIEHKLDKFKVMS